MTTDSDWIMPESDDTPEGIAKRPPHHSISGALLIGGYGIWSWDFANVLWILVEDKSEPGFGTGDGPSDPGRFHGQTIRWASIVVEDSGEIE